jgi:dolichol-phosphate mannosyltransferase
LQTNEEVNYFPTQLIVAALNEENGIGLTLEELRNVMSNSSILVVDGNSRDKTVEIAKDLGANIVFQNGVGKGDAVAKGISLMDNGAKYIVLTDADYTYPAEYIPSMIEILEQNPEVGMVCGNRLGGKADEKALHSQFYFGNRILALAHNILNGVELEDPLTGLRVVRADILRSWKIRSKGFDIEVELNAQVIKQGYRTVEVPIRYRERIGEKKLKMRHGATILKRIILEI